MAKETSEAYWTSPEASLSHLALRTDDAKVWAAFLRAAQRAETGLRMELMNTMNYTREFKEQRLSFLTAFLNDTALRILPSRRDSSKYDGPCAAFTIPRLRVCDFAAMKIAGILDWPDRPDESWTEEQWKNFEAGEECRAEVRGSGRKGRIIPGRIQVETICRSRLGDEIGVSLCPKGAIM